jgi:glycosyltransferase involved in cell wall biosynthesis
MQQKRKVAFIFSGLYVGGAEKFGITLANQFVRSGFPTYFILFQKLESPYYQLLDSGIEVIHIERKSKLDNLLHHRFHELLQTHGITDAFYFCLKPLLYTRLLARKRPTSTRFYITLHSTIPVNFKERIKTEILLRFVRKDDMTVFICNNQRIYFKNKYHFDPNNKQIIYNGVDTDHFKPESGVDRMRLRTEMGVTDEAKIILLVATLRPEKGHADALKALKRLFELQPLHSNTHLVCVGGGDGPYLTQLAELAMKLGIKKHVHFAGNQKNVRPYYLAADIFTLTSVSVETFSIAALEAMSFGLPLSLTDIGGASEMVYPGKNGLLSEAGNVDSIARSWMLLLDEKPDNDAIRRIALENFSIQKTFTAYVKLIEHR